MSPTQRGKPIAAVKIVISGHNSDRGRLRPDKELAFDSFYGRTETRFTDDLGRYRFRDLAAGEYSVRVHAGGLANAPRKVTLSADRDLEDVDFELEHNGTLRFDCIDESGMPVGGVQMRATRARIRRDPTVYSDSMGKAVLRFLPDETYEIRTWIAGDFVAPSPFEVRPGDDEITIKLTRSAVVDGRIVTRDGSSAEGLLIEATWGEGQRKATVSKAQGSFSLQVQHGATVNLVVDGRRRRQDTRFIEFPRGQDLFRQAREHRGTARRRPPGGRPSRPRPHTRGVGA